MLPLKPATAARAVVVSFYKKATYCYAAPFILLLLGFLAPLPGAIGLFALLPLGAAGLFFTSRGLALAAKSRDREKQDVGYANLVLGAAILVLGLLFLAFAYVRTS